MGAPVEDNEPSRQREKIACWFSFYRPGSCGKLEISDTMKGGANMIYGTGIDLTEIDRIQKMLAAGLRLPQKVLTPAELAVFNRYQGRRRAEFLAGRFSAKEAYSKAFGTGIGAAVGFHDIEILDDQLGKPALTRHPFDGPGWVSISHTDQLVMTQVILERGKM